MRHLLTIALALAILLTAAWSAASLLAPSPLAGDSPTRWSRLSTALSLNPANADYWLLRAERALRAGSGLPAGQKSHAAQQSLRQASRLAPSWEVPLLSLANACAGDYSRSGGSCPEACRRLYLAVLHRDPSYGYAIYRYADLLYECARRDPGDLAEKSREICRRYGQSLHLMRPTLDYRSWYITAEQNAYSKCLALAPAYSQARALAPESPRQWANMAQEMVKHKGPQAYYEHKDAILRDIEKAPGQRSDYIALCRSLELAGLTREGVEALRQYLTRHPDDSKAWEFLLMTMLGHHKDFTGPEIIEALDLARAQARFSPRQTLILAMAACRGGQVEASLELFTRATANDPDDAGIFASLGGCLLSKGRLEEAIGAYGRAVALKPNSPYYHVSLARAYAKGKRYQAAVEELQRALTLNPGNQEVKKVLREIGIY